MGSIAAYLFAMLARCLATPSIYVGYNAILFPKEISEVYDSVLRVSD